MSELNGMSTPSKDYTPKNNQSPQTLLMEDGVDTSIDHLYDNVCEMQSSNQSPSRHSFGSDEDESRIDWELRHLVGGEMKEIEIMEEVDVDNPNIDLSLDKNITRSLSSIPAKEVFQLKSKNEASSKLSPRTKGPVEKKPPVVMRNAAVTPVKRTDSPIQILKFPNGSECLDNPNTGPFLLKHARDLVSSGDNYEKALELALRAERSFDSYDGRPSLELVTCLQVIAAIYCSLGHHIKAIHALERSIEIPVTEEGKDHALAKFSGLMQLGDTYTMLGELENSIRCFITGLEIQKQALGKTDPRVGETCRYVAEAYVQMLQFDEAKKLCQAALDIHRENSPDSLQEAADRKLMGLICETKGDYEAAIEHLVLASMSMVANGLETEAASVDCSIGDMYLSLARYDEAGFAYRKALTVLKSVNGDNHPAVALVFVRLADLYNRTGRMRDSKSYCESALRIYNKSNPGISQEEIASGLTDISAVYESMNELEQAVKLLKRALKIYKDAAPGQQSVIAGIEAQMGVMLYMSGNYSESYESFENAVGKLRGNREKKSALLGITLNQMGLACVQRCAINEAADLFEEARSVLEQECGQYHPDTLGVYSNLAGTYDALGRLDDAIEILEYVVRMREEKLGTANPNVDDERKRLEELLKEAGRVRNKESKTLENLLHSNPPPLNL